MLGEGLAIGIDLGTTYSCAGVYPNDEVYPNDVIFIWDYDNCTTSSCVAFTDKERLIGHEAKTQVVLNPENTIFNSKRMIGRKFNDPKIQQDLQYWQFKVVNKDGKPKVRAEVEGETKTFFPEEISAMLLTKMKMNAELYLGKKVLDAVISVPACFNDSQRQATINAAKIAGLNVVKLVTEPTAVALAYKALNPLIAKETILIFDLGGGTLDVSIINISDDLQFEVKTTAGDSHLGGEDFDNVLVAHFVEEFKTKHWRDLRTCPKALRRLRIECEYAKRTLSSCLEVSIYINCLFEGINFHSKLTRVQFEDMCMDLFRSTMKPVERALSDAGMANGSIDKVVLVGGSTRIPKIKELLKEFFDVKVPFVFFDPDVTVAFGAAIQAAVLTGRAGDKINSFVLVDIAPFSLGIETDWGVMAPIIQRNSQMPCLTSLIFPDVDIQLSIEVEYLWSFDMEVYEGEQAVAKDNRLLGTFCIEGIPPVLKGVPQMEVRFHLDANGILDVSAELGETQSISVIADKGGLSINEVDEMLEEAKRCQWEDTVHRDRNEARREFINYVYSVKLMIEYTSNYGLSEDDRVVAMNICETFLDWIEETPLEEPGVILNEMERADHELSVYIKIMERERLR